MKFEWDKNKEKLNIQKHGVTFEQASYVFTDQFALNKYDDEHSKDEDRWVILGKSLNETLLLVVHTFRDNNNIEFVRIISARKATKKETNISKKVSIMKDEYDFTNAEQGKFYRPIEELDIPIYLDNEVKNFFFKNLKEKASDFSLNNIVNSLIKQDIEISKRLAY